MADLVLTYSARTAPSGHALPLDSDVLIDISRNKTECIDYVDALPDVWAISRVTAMELLVGARGKGLTLVTRNKRHFAMIDGLILQVPDY